MKKVCMIILLVISTQGHAAPDISAYGFVKAGVSVASRAVESFGSANLSAPVRVFPTTDPVLMDTRSSFQLSQSRVGFWVNKKGPASGQLEVDFIDFEKSSPVTKALPRLRVAMARFSVTEHDTLGVGQDWDVFSPGKPHTFNYVGLFFGAGNVGFIRPQIKWTHTQGQWTWESALGLVAANATATDGDAERSNTPSVSGMLAYAHDDKSRVGISALAGRLRFTSGESELRGYYGLNAFLDQSLGGNAELHSEVYYGENLGSVGTLSLALGALGESRHEWGGFVTAKLPIVGAFSGLVGVGYAAILEDNGSLLKGIGAYRVQDNLKVSAAAAYSVDPALQFYAEMALLKTRFFTLASASSDSMTAGVLDTGAVYTF